MVEHMLTQQQPPSERPLNMSKRGLILNTLRIIDVINKALNDKRRAIELGNNIALALNGWDGRLDQPKREIIREMINHRRRYFGLELTEEKALELTNAVLIAWNQVGY